jgi:two-component system response regulator BaeR
MERKKEPYILIVEDDRNLSYFLKKFLRSNDFKTKIVEEGQRALQTALEKNFDLIILDIGLPGISGLELMDRLRAENDNTPVIVVTNQLSQENELHSFSKGANLFHKKPINYDLLLVQIRSFVNNDVDDVEIKLGDIFINPSKRLLLCDEQKVKLTKNEFDFLLLLTVSNGKVFSRYTITHRILNKSHEVEPGAVDTLVSRLRKKLEKYDKDDLIETVYKAGYRLNTDYLEF